MNVFKIGSLASLLILFFPAGAKAQSSDDLSGYTPPPMFGGAAPSTPATSSPSISSTPSVSPTPEVKPEPKIEPKKINIVPRETTSVTRPPEDRDAQILKPEPLPIEPIVKRGVQIPVKPPAASDKTPPYIKPAKRVLVAKPPEDATTKKIPSQAENSVKPTVVQGLKAEDLLNHSVTSEDDTTAPTMPTLPDPMAVPAPAVDQGLPLPGSVKDSKILKKPAPKAEAKKSEPVKIEPKKETKKEKIAETKLQPKKIETKKNPVVSKPKPKPVEIKKSSVQKSQPLISEEDKEMVRKANNGSRSLAPESKTDKIKIDAAEKKILNEKPEKSDIDPKQFHLSGKKNMPKAIPEKVEKTELTKAPLPTIEQTAPVTPPNPNEKIIDRALEERLVDPDIKKIATPPAGKAASESPSPKTVSKPSLISMEFKQELSEVQPDQKKTIDLEVLPKLKASPSTRLQILAYASAAKEGQSSARRISLSRGLSLRAYLLEKGIEPSRIDIRALGDNTLEKPLDRVDLLVIGSK